MTGLISELPENSMGYLFLGADTRITDVSILPEFLSRQEQSISFRSRGHVYRYRVILTERRISGEHSSVSILHVGAAPLIVPSRCLEMSVARINLRRVCFFS